MNKIIRYFIKYPVAGRTLVIFTVIAGLLALKSIKSTPSPQINPNIIEISASYPGASPEEMERGILLKIEKSLKGVNGISKTVATASEDSCSVSVHVTSTFNMQEVLENVKNKVNGIIFPAGMEPINIHKSEFRDEAIFFAITGKVSLKQLKKTARKIESDFRAADTVSLIGMSGFPDEEIEISFREKDMRRYNLTFSEVHRKVLASNLDLTGGYIRGNRENLMIRTKQKRYHARALSDIVIRADKSGRILRLGDIADLQDKWAETPNATYVNGLPAILFTISNNKHEDVLKISDYIKSYVKEFNRTSTDIKAVILFSMASEIEVMQKILLNNGIAGFLLVIFILSLFLNIRLAFWVGMAIPISILGMFIIGNSTGMTMNFISLFGMILVLGILVDDGVVIGESIFTHYKKGMSPVEAAVTGTTTVFPAVFSGVATTIIAFSIFFFLDGMFGQFFVELSIAVIGSLTVSLIESALILPAHLAHSQALNPANRNRRDSGFQKLFNKLRLKFFAPLLKFSIKNGIVALTICFTLFLISLGAVMGGILRVGETGAGNSDYTTVTLEMPSGTPQHITEKYLKKLEESFIKAGNFYDKQRSDQKHTILNTNYSIDSFNSGTVSATLISRALREVTTSKFLNKVREINGPIPEARKVNYSVETYFGKPVSISLQSSDLDELEAARIMLTENLNRIPELKNVSDNYQTGEREVKITLKNRAFLLGLDLSEVMNQVRQGFFGMEVQRINRGTDEIKIQIRYRKSDRSTIGNLEEMRIRTSDNREYPIKEIANMTYERNLTSINHINSRREITVEADVRDRHVALNKVKEKIEYSILDKIRELYPSISFRAGGQDEEMAKTMGSIKKVAPTIATLLFLIIVFTFRSLLQGVMVFTLIPLGFIGVASGHLIHDLPLSMPSYLGIVALIGVMVNNAIVMIDTFNRFLRSGIAVPAALFRAAMTRFRPIILTSITTIVGLAPLIMSKEPAAQALPPMAVSMAYGLLFSTLLTLFGLPSLLITVNTMKVRFLSILKQRDITRESVEPAIKELIHSEQYGE